MGAIKNCQHFGKKQEQTEPHSGSAQHLLPNSVPAQLLGEIHKSWGAIISGNFMNNLPRVVASPQTK